VTGARVLVIDDESQIQRVLRPALTACGYEVLEATTGHDALRMIAASAPDVAVLDLASRHGR
jgi:two-component system KDP operon response regulator KdpE